MAITEADIKLLASERLNDDADGGGFPSAAVIQDNVENNLFPDISALDRAQGAVDFRKFYPAVLTNDTDVYFGAHLVLDVIPADPAVSCFLVVGTTLSQERAACAASLNSALIYGAKPIKLQMVVDDRTADVGSLNSKLIPSTFALSGTSGSMVAGASPDYGGALFPVGATTAVGEFLGLWNANSQNGLLFRMRAIPNSVTGTYNDTAAGSGIVLSSTQVEGIPYLTMDGGHNTLYPFLGNGIFTRFNGTVPYGVDTGTVSATYQPALALTNLPRIFYEYDYTNVSVPSLSLTIADTPEVGSESVYWTTVTGQEIRMDNTGLSEFFVAVDPTATFNAQGSVNRGTRLVSLLLDPPPKVGTKVRIGYVKAGYILNIPVTDLASSNGTFTAGECTATIATDHKFAGAFFGLGANFYEVDQAGVVRLANPSTSLNLGSQPTTVVGSYDFTANKLICFGFTGVMTFWRGCQVSTLIPVTKATGLLAPNFDLASVVVSGKKVPSLATWTATANSSGVFSTAVVSGTYEKATGYLNLAFTENVGVTLTYTANQQVFTPTPAVVTGIDPDLFAVDGGVPVFATGRVAVLHNTQTVAAATYANTDTVNTRANVADVRVWNSVGAQITTGFTVNKATGVLTVNSISGWSQPVTITHRIEVMAVITGTTSAGKVTLSKPAAHTYPANTSYLSSVLVLGDVQGRVHSGFQQVTWTGVWSDAIIGATINADFNEPVYPITTTNKGAITQRWAVIFTNTTAFKVVGEDVGEIATGNVAALCAPNNPATGVPYFSIPLLGWGSGWATGNVYRFNTNGALAPTWLLRSIDPSDPFVGQDKVTVAVRGDINA